MEVPNQKDNQNQLLLQPFLPSAAAVKASTTPFSRPPRSSWDSHGLILRLGFLICIGIISIWANHEASNGFSIAVVNDAPGQPPGRRFDLFYVSDDGASRLLLTASKFVEDFLYPDPTYPKKQVSSVVLRLSSRNLTQQVVVDSGEVNGQFTVHISPSVLEELNFKQAMFVAMQRGMVRLWLWGGSGGAPAELVNGIVEYVTELAVSGAGGMRGFVSGDAHCWKSGNPMAVARFLSYCEMDKPGFIRRLNRSMRNGWHDRMVDDALGVHVQHLCDAYNPSGK